MSKKLFFLLSVIISSLILTGCFEVTTEISLRKDGSGTLRQRVLFSQVLVSQMKNMAMSMGADESDGSHSMYDEEKLINEASKYGEGVVFTSGSEIRENGKEGYEALYSFTDIGKVVVGNNPSSVIEIPTGTADDSMDLIRFEFEKNNISSLTIIMPESEDTYEEETAEESSGEKEMDEESMEMMKQMFSGMKFSYKINFEGVITETDADNISGSTITLMEIDFDKLMKNPESFRNFENLQGDNSKETVKAMKDMEGVKIEMKERIAVKFR